MKTENGGGRQSRKRAQKDAILERPSRPSKATKEGLDPPLEPAASLAFRFFTSFFKNRFECVFGILSYLLKAKTEVSPHKRKRSLLVGSRCFQGAFSRETPTLDRRHDLDRATRGPPGVGKKHEKSTQNLVFCLKSHGIPVRELRFVQKISTFSLFFR